MMWLNQRLGHDVLDGGGFLLGEFVALRLGCDRVVLSAGDVPGLGLGGVVGLGLL